MTGQQADEHEASKAPQQASEANKYSSEAETQQPQAVAFLSSLPETNNCDFVSSETEPNDEPLLLSFG